MVEGLGIFTVRGSWGRARGLRRDIYCTVQGVGFRVHGLGLTDI